MSLEQSTLTAFMDAVTNYYGGADIWTGITDAGAFTSAEFAAKVTQVDGVTAMYNAAGDVLYYKYNDQIVANAVDLANSINSNVGSTVASSSVNLPANTAVSTGGTVAATSGMTAAGGTTAAVIVKDVALGVAAVGAGIQLGAAIDGALYNLNPDFWDENNMSSLNPQTWDTLVSDYGEPATKVFNMVFGIDQNTNKVQPYMDERALAYITQYMIAQGAWDSGEPTHPDYETGDIITSLVVENMNLPPQPAFSDPVYHNNQTAYNNVTTCIANMLTTSPTAEGYKFYCTGGDCYVTAYKNIDVSGLIGQTYDETITYSAPCDIDEWYTYNNTVYHRTYTNWIYLQYPPLWMLDDLPATITNPLRGSSNNLIYYCIGATTGGGGVEGITTQDGATIPTGITPQMSIDDVITQLQILYPDLFNNKITNNVVQPDGTVKTYIYVPVSIPENVPLDDVTNALKPTGGQNLTQGDTAVDPTTTPDSIIDTLLKIIGSTDPNNPTQNPTDTPTEYPDTGEGNTPAIILPTGSASALYSVYNPSQSQLNSLGAWLWSSNFVDQLLKLFNDPMQAIIGLHKVFATPLISGTGTIKVGYLDSGVGSNLVSSQYSEVDCGTVQLKEYFGNALDYIKTDVYLYLPFVGIVPLNVEDVTRATIGVKYKVDVLTGACLATVNVTRDNNAGGQLYVYAGNCSVQYPLSSGSYMGIVASALGIAGSIAGTVLSGGAMLPMALGVGASALGNARTKVEHSGSISGNAGAMGIKKPYLIIRRPQTKIADNYPLLAGGSDNVYGVLSSFTGHTRVKYVHIENISATSDELNEIETLLKSGVMI